MSAASKLFTEFRIRGITFRNRIGVSPMCQYSSVNGKPTDWHLHHLGTIASSRPGLTLVEATAVEPRGRISPQDMGIWSDEHIEPLRRLAQLIKTAGSVPGIQIAHAGRKASTAAPWFGRKNVSIAEGGWTPVAPSNITFRSDELPSHELTLAEIAQLKQDFVAGARRAVDAGFEVIELHGAHGYLLHSFYSPLLNKRTDQYGGEGRFNFIWEVTTAVRKALPERIPIFVRISTTDWAEGGTSESDRIRLVEGLLRSGADLIDCSSGGAVPHQRIPAADEQYQTRICAEIRKRTGAVTAAVGLITRPEQAEALIANGSADMVLVAREFLRQPLFTLVAAKALGAAIPAPVQYERAWLPAKM
eukprot:TRINITY_DN4006_c0_g1_i1.p1 TRINITY_DN4006_c0_g1~~TRINITY_DN4006_c0_g1_i1.p1  ORF type:complete len:374 (-),score=67.45 TRINITY_DN4006_c0_g1_i1:6-1088(-)